MNWFLENLKPQVKQKVQDLHSERFVPGFEYRLVAKDPWLRSKDLLKFL